MCRRFRRVEEDAPVEADDVGDQPCQLTDADIFADTDVDDLGCVVTFHQKDGGIGEIHVEELARRSA